MIIDQPRGLRVLNRHTMVIPCPLERVGVQLISWGEASWWPRRCASRFIPLTEGPIGIGTRYQQLIDVPLFGPQWTVEISRIVPGQLVERTFLDGMFSGFERIEGVEITEGTQVIYAIHGHLRHWSSRWMWPVLFERLHDHNIQMILSALKDFMLNQDCRKEKNP
jgi:hypothetical protein